MIKAEVDDKKCKIVLKGIEKQGKNMTLAMRIIAKDLQSSIERNFEVGGRYSSKDSIVGGSKKWDISKYGGGSLMFSSGSKRAPIRRPLPIYLILCGLASELALKKSEKFDKILGFRPNFWSLCASEVAVDFIEFPVRHAE